MMLAATLYYFPMLNMYFSNMCSLFGLLSQPCRASFCVGLSNDSCLSEWSTHTRLHCFLLFSKTSIKLVDIVNKMAWTSGCSGSTNDELVMNLLKAGIINKTEVVNAMKNTDRAKYVPIIENNNKAKKSSKYQYGPYADAPQPIGYKVTISAPYIHGINIEALYSKIIGENSRILDVGCGSGVLVGYMARLAPISSTIVGIEVVEGLVELSKRNLIGDGFHVTDSIAEGTSRPHCKIIIRHGDGWEGAADLGPYDAINVGAGARCIPQALIDQLKPDGVLLIPVGEMVQGSQSLWKINKHHKHMGGDIDSVTVEEGYELEKTLIRTVRFVPLVEKEQHKKVLDGDVTENEIEGGIDWNKRYEKGWAYGKKPNQFLVENFNEFLQSKIGTAPLRILSLGEGQGRNAVYLATLGCTVTAVDKSSVGVAKIKLLAEQFGVSNLVKTVVSDLNEYMPTEQYDAIISIFCMLPRSSTRSQLHERCVDALVPGGKLIVECFAPDQAVLIESQKNEKKTVEGKKVYEPGQEVTKTHWRRVAIGPPRDCLVDGVELMREFSGLEVLLSKQVKRELHEGAFHRGLACLTQIVAVKPQSRVTLSRIIENSFRLTMNEVFESMLTDSTSGLDGGFWKSTDTILDNSTQFVRNSCIECDRCNWCRYCWCEKKCCICSNISRVIEINQLSADNNINIDALETFHFVVVSHPNEFLRSTSSAKILVQYIESLNSVENEVALSIELLVYGCPRHMERLTGHLRDAGSLYLLYPDETDDVTNDIHVHENTSMIDMLQCHNISANDVSVSGSTSTDTRACQENVRTTIIIPDGSWECTKAMVKEMRKQVSPALIPNIALDVETVATHHSPLIEALKSGQGTGRISTLEACGLFLRGVGYEAVSSKLMCCLDPLVKYVKSHFHAPSVDAPIDADLLMNIASALCQYISKTGHKSQLPMGLRWCDICNENLATPSRMQQHLSGKKHCNEVARNYLSSCPNEGAAPKFPLDDTQLLSIYERYCDNIIGNSIPEPPDVALHLLKLEMQADTSASKSKISKGERIWAKTAKPNVTSELPTYLRQMHILGFQIASYDVVSAARDLLASLPATIGSFPTAANMGKTQILENYVLSTNVFRNFKARQVVYKAVSECEPFLKQYEQLVIEVVCPYIKSLMIQHSNEADSESEYNANSAVSFHYQYPPSLRLQSGNSDEYGRKHRDAEYGHQIGEINFWMPLSNYQCTNTTLWIETNSNSDIEKYEPLILNVGEIGMFHGTLLRHYVPSNTSPYTRVSLDFRIGVENGKYFDSSWEMKGLKGKHGRKHVML